MLASVPKPGIVPARARYRASTTRRRNVWTRKSTNAYLRSQVAAVRKHDVQPQLVDVARRAHGLVSPARQPVVLPHRQRVRHDVLHRVPSQRRCVFSCCDDEKADAERQFDCAAGKRAGGRRQAGHDKRTCGEGQYSTKRPVGP